MSSFKLLVFLIFIQLLHLSSGCNKRTIVLRGPKLFREKCVGCRGDQSDVEQAETVPPEPGTTETIIFSIQADTGSVTDAGGLGTGVGTGNGTASSVIPIGDCKCGMGISWDMVKSEKGSTNQLNRPWMVHFRIQLENKEYIECSGSLINRRWIISAAHCFCPLNEHVQCAQVNRGFNKKLSGKDSNYHQDLNTRINITFGSTDAAYTKSKDLGVEIEKIIIHPDYWEDKTKHGNAYDLALIKTNKDIYSGDGIMDDDNKMMLIHPICLPPYGHVDWEMTRTNFTEQFFGQNKTGDQYPWMRKDSPRIPFEDMDCVVSFKPEIQVPNPTNAQAGWLKCHPDKFASDPYNDKDINVMGRNSFITAFGSLAHPLTLTGLAPYGGKRVCRSNEYSPVNNVFKKCRHNRCLKDVDNPSLNNSMCKRFQEKAMQNLSADTTVAVLKDPDNPYSIVYCYPWDNKAVKDVSSYNHKPYSGGWCDTCDPYNQKDVDCMVTPEDNWGWCVPGCDGSQDQNTEEQFRKSVHELPVDAFVYENCSINVDTFTEFCTGSAITQGKMKEYRYQEPMVDAPDKAPFNLLRTVARKFHSGDIGWNGNGTIIRLGARYQGRQHSSYQGDSCFGDAGGAIWKYWAFRDPSSDGLGQGRKLAVLTGVISRFEEMCGAFSPWPSQEVGDEPNLPTQHTVHARVQSHLDWIVRNVFSKGSCG